MLKSADVDAIRERIFADRATPPVAAESSSATVEAGPTSVQLLHLSPVELVKLGLITFRGLVVVGIAFGAFWQFDLDDEFFDRLREWGAVALPTSGSYLWVTIVVSVFVAFLAVAVLSVVWAVVTLFDYRLVRVGEDLRVTCGLITRLTTTIPRKRIQLVSVRETLLHRLFGRVSISVETAGGSGQLEKIPFSRRWLVPLLPKAQLAELLPEIQPDFELTNVAWEPLSAAGQRRMVRKETIIWTFIVSAVAAGIALWIWVWSATAHLPHGLIVSVIPLLAFGVWALLIWHAKLEARSIAFAYNGRGIAFRSGHFVRQASTTNYDRVQAVECNETPFDRRWDMASVGVDTAGAGPSGHRIRIPYLEKPVALRLRDDFASRTEKTDFNWHRE